MLQIQPKKGVPEKNNPGPGDYTTTKPFGEEGTKISINPLKTERSTKKFITPGPGQYDGLELGIGQKYPISHLRNTVSNVWGFSKVKRFRPAYSNFIKNNKIYLNTNNQIF